jgi:hypothetical protein
MSCARRLAAVKLALALAEERDRFAPTSVSDDSPWPGIQRIIG